MSSTRLLAARAKQGRTCDTEIVVFDSTGTGIQDVAVAAAAYEVAMAKRGSKKNT